MKHIFLNNKVKAALSIMAALSAMLPSTFVEAATDASGEKKSGLPQLDMSTYASQIFWLCVSFAILYVIFSKKTLPTISDVLERRRETISSDLETAETLKEEAESVKQEYEDSILQARQEGADILQELQTDIRADLEKDLNEFKEKSSVELQSAEQKASEMKNTLMNDIQSDIPEITKSIVNKLTGIDVDKKDIISALNSKTNNKAKAA